MNAIQNAKNNIISLKKNTLSLLIMNIFFGVFFILAIVYYTNESIRILESSFFKDITPMNTMNYYLNNLTNEQRSIILLIFISFFILQILFLFLSIRIIFLSNRIEELFEPSKKYNLFIFSIIGFIFPFIIFQIILFVKSSNLKNEFLKLNGKSETINIKPIVTKDNNPEIDVVGNIDSKKLNQNQISNHSTFDINSLRKTLLVIKEMLHNNEISYNEYIELKAKIINSI